MQGPPVLEGQGSNTRLVRPGSYVAAFCLYGSIFLLLSVEVAWLWHSVTAYHSAAAPAGQHYQVIDQKNEEQPVAAAPPLFGQRGFVAQLNIQLNHINDGDQTASATFTLLLDAAVLNQMRDPRTGQSVLECTPVPTLCPADAADQLLIDGYVSARNDTLVRIDPLPIPLGTFRPYFEPSAPALVENNEWSGPLISGGVQDTLPLDGDTTLYPLDWYSVNTTLALDVPAPLQFGPGSRNDVAASIPVDVSITTGQGMSPYTVLVGKLDSGHSLPSRVALLFTRDYATLFYVGGIAFIPLMLAVVFGHFLAVRRAEETVQKPEVLAALAAFLFAVLPLRVVLVPSDLTALTYVDTVLGIGVVAIVTIVLFEYAYSVWPEPADWVGQMLIWPLSWIWRTVVWSLERLKAYSGWRSTNVGTESGSGRPS